ncbi:MAG TPA: xanthine dehydrogenase family protein subunit M [Luteitalea sp.]|nr:xanthine dehydrogenase family protein subunit M [Luteitalea sp.]
MIPTAFEYARATSIDDALHKLAASGDGGKLLAGGHSLVPLMKLRLSEPQMLVDISRIPELQGVDERDGTIVIGAATVHHDVASSAVLKDRCPALAEAAASIGDPQVRNRGTIGGSVAHADPSADIPAVLLALDAQIHLQSATGTRVVAAADFFQGLFTVDMRPDEIITRVQFVPVRSAAYAKLHQRASHYAIVGVAAALAMKDGTIATARIGLTGATSHAIRLTAAEQVLAGQAPTPEVFARVADAAAGALEDVNADIHASAEYRTAMVSVFVRRALAAAGARV